MTRASQSYEPCHLFILNHSGSYGDDETFKAITVFFYHLRD